MNEELWRLTEIVRSKDWSGWNFFGRTLQSRGNTMSKTGAIISEDSKGVFIDVGTGQQKLSFCYISSYEWDGVYLTIYNDMDERLELW